MSISGKRRSITFIAVAALVGAVSLAQPAHGDTFTVNGTVGTGHLPVASGEVYFYATCRDYYDDHFADVDTFEGGHYAVSVPSGTYRVFIDPDKGTAALPSFHSAKSECGEADVVTVVGNTTVDLVALPESFNVNGSVSSGNGPITQASVYFYASCEDAAARRDAGTDYSLEYGTFGVTVPAGVYRVLIRPGTGSRAVTSWHDAKMTCEEATPIVVNAALTINLNAAGLYTVKGAFRSAAGVVQSGSVGLYTDCQAFAAKRRTDGGGLTAGTYSVDVPPGTYVFYARVTAPANIVTSWHGPAMTCERATPVTISADTTLDLTLMARQRIKGGPQGLELGTRKPLPKRTREGARVRWTVITPKSCRVQKSTLIGRREGRCKVRAAAREIAGYMALSQVFWVQVYKPRS